MKRFFFCFFVIATLYSCSYKDDNLVTPEQSHYEMWTELITVDSLGKENSRGNFIVKNVLEFYDSTYKFTSATVKLVDSTNITSDLFFIQHTGLYRFHTDTLSVFTSDNIYISNLKTLKTDSTLSMESISKCAITNGGHFYLCQSTRGGGIVVSFLWERLRFKSAALFIRSL